MDKNKILIVDDRPAIAELIAHGAAACGYATRIEADGRSFLAACASFRPTHVVLDLMLPDIDGIELLRTLAEQRTTAAIVLASGMGGKLVESARRFGRDQGLDMAGTLLKPFGRADVCALLDGLRIEATDVTPESLAHALDGGELFVAYQPKIDLATGGVAAFEALVRWNHPRRGMVMPGEFLPMAEAAGLMGRLTELVSDGALAALAAWRETFDGRIAINLSARGLDDVAFPDRLAEHCAALGLEPRRVDLDFAEAGADGPTAAATDVLMRLRLKGFGLALDDFGTGQSSLVQLVRLPFNEIKIDRSFVAECLDSDEARAIVKSTIDLAHSLSLRAVAEGIESAAVLQRVAALGCDLGSGFHFAPPLAFEQVPEWLDGWRARRAEWLAPAGEGAGAPGARARRSFAGSVWTRPYDGSDELRKALADLLSERLNPLWNLGRNSLVGWRVAAGGIEALLLPYRRIVTEFGRSRRLLHGRRLMGDATFETAREVAGSAPVHIPLPFHISDDEAGAVPTQAIEQVLRRYGISETLYRGVALFDIVGFSRTDPSRQIAQLNSLECSINAAQKLMAEAGTRVDLARTTTGDGFYMWNREKGPAADIDTYLIALLTLADNALARAAEGPEFVPELRTCYAIGPHYSYFQTEALDPRGHDYIVGDVTIALARMISKCLPGQILIRDFLRPTDPLVGLQPGEAPTDPVAFMRAAQGAFARLGGARLHNRALGVMRCYLTGRESEPGRFDITRYTIRDKHGFEHAVFNQKLNIYLAAGPTAAAPGAANSNVLYLGRRRSDLAGFEAERAVHNLWGENASSDAAE